MNGAPSFLAKHGVKLAFSLVLAGTFVWLLHAGALPVLPPREAFAEVEWGIVVLYVLGWSLVHFVRAWRWTFLLEPIERVPMRKLLGASFVGFAAIALLPVRTGEAVRPLMIRSGPRLRGWVAMGTIAAERIIDGLVLCLMLLAGLWLSKPLSPLPDRIGDLPISPAVVPRASYAALALFAVAFVVMGVFYAYRDFARRATRTVVGAVSPRLATWLSDRVEHVADGLRFLPQLRYSAPFIATTAFYWLLNSACTELVARGTGFPNFTYAEACVTTGVVALGILVPNAPGFFGAYQFSFYAALAVFYPPADVVGPGAACVLIVYSCQLLITIVGGMIGAALARTDARSVLRTAAENLPEAATQE
ncbi:MAG TPA: lysylphosphatidylglycerol synthase transmembrane domain-containing protein [Polyangiaceae bacterium]|nr:lysylphosphatidylglycerol synthase transmembrane domain-containing protein [Polyangiaceae bacterium]